MAPVVLALRSDARFSPILISTGQHGQMLDHALGAFSLRPDIDLALSASHGSLESFLGSVLEPLGRVLSELKPELTLVQGDTISVLAAAQASFLRRVPVGHVEAGLRTGDIEQPYPEEAMRRMVSVVTSLHFAPTSRARDVLLGEGVDPEKVWVTGNTGIDAMRRLRIATPGIDVIRDMDFERSRLILVTAHRRENHGAPLADICRAVKDIVQRFDDVQVILPVHANPAVQAAVYASLGDVERVHLLPPLDYPDLVYIMRQATLILTDSGGIQEEAPSCHTPVLILRNVTERPEVVEAGAGLLVGTERTRIVSAVEQLLTDDAAYRSMANVENPFGDGYAAERIVRIIGQTFAHGRIERAS